MEKPRRFGPLHQACRPSFARSDTLLASLKGDCDGEQQCCVYIHYSTGCGGVKHFSLRPCAVSVRRLAAGQTICSNEPIGAGAMVILMTAEYFGTGAKLWYP